MNRNIESLYCIAQKNERRILGLMSGTSLDGLDIAVCRISGSGHETNIVVEHFETLLFEADLKKSLAEVCFQENVSLQKITLLNKHIAVEHAKLVNGFLDKRKIAAKEIDLIASHGQTIYHAPLHLHNDASCGHASLQIGDGDNIATATGIITISDFRQKHIAGGGEGAPLAAYGDLLLFAEKENDVVMLNIGGISNFTYLPAKGQLISSDIGPGNTLMNAFVQITYGDSQDTDAKHALKGNINESLLEALKDHLFFAADIPKTTGPELFSLSFIHTALERSGTKNISPQDILATLNKLSADSITSALDKITGEQPFKLYVSGGGIHNPLLMRHLRETLKNATFHSTEEKNIPADAKEAALFALLANETVAGDTAVFEGVFGMPAVSMGKISFPF